MAEPPRRTYSQEEVTEILKRALRQQSLRGNQLSHDELVEMADEVGIDRDALDAATADLVQTREAELVQNDEARELAEERARRFARFVGSLFTFLVIGVACYFVNKGTGGYSWFYWPIMGFAIALAFQLRGIFFPYEGLERRRRRALKEARRDERRAAREAMRNRMRASFGAPPMRAVNEAVNHGAKEFEAAVQAGVAAMLTVAARKIQAHADRAAEDDDRRRRAAHQVDPLTSRRRSP
jgi:2TM domain